MEKSLTASLERVEQNPDDEQLRNSVIVELVLAGEAEEACRVYESCSPYKLRDLRSNYGYALNLVGRLTEATKIFEELTQGDPEDEIARNFFGMMLLKSGRLEEAVDQFVRVVRERPKSVEGWNNLGCARYRLGDRRDAIRCFDRAIAIDPYNPDGHNNRACVLEDLGEEAMAEEEFRLAEELSLESKSTDLRQASTLEPKRLSS